MNCLISFNLKGTTEKSVKFRVSIFSKVILNRHLFSFEDVHFGPDYISSIFTMIVRSSCMVQMYDIHGIVKDYVMDQEASSLF